MSSVDGFSKSNQEQNSNYSLSSFAKKSNQIPATPPKEQSLSHSVTAPFAQGSLNCAFPRERYRLWLELDCRMPNNITVTPTKKAIFKG